MNKEKLRHNFIIILGSYVVNYAVIPKTKALAPQEMFKENILQIVLNCMLIKTSLTFQPEKKYTLFWYLQHNHAGAKGTSQDTSQKKAYKYSTNVQLNYCKEVSLGINLKVTLQE